MLLCHLPVELHKCLALFPSLPFPSLLFSSFLFSSLPFGNIQLIFLLVLGNSDSSIKKEKQFPVGGNGRSSWPAKVIARKSCLLFMASSLSRLKIWFPQYLDIVPSYKIMENFIIFSSLGEAVNIFPKGTKSVSLTDIIFP